MFSPASDTMQVKNSLKIDVQVFNFFRWTEDDPGLRTIGKGPSTHIY